MTTQNQTNENVHRFMRAQTRFKTAWLAATFPIDETILGKDTYDAILDGACIYMNAIRAPASAYRTIAYGYLARDAEKLDNFGIFVRYIELATEAIESAIEGVA